MTLLTKAIASIFAATSFVSLSKFNHADKNGDHPPLPVTQHNATPKIQAAILLDVSGSMSGLIDQAKAQLWNMVSVMGKAKCNEATPQIEIALYEYGRTSNDAKQGYVKQISSFTTDLDQLSQNLFSLQTDGGEEYCGHVIYSSINELNWDTAAANYKVIFISGNEDFLQGDIGFTKACDAAKQKGVIVNTIYCGDRMNGIQEHWNLGSECGDGSYTNIDKDAKLDDIETPYDSTLFSLNEKLNGTYIAYGYRGTFGLQSQLKMDKMNYSLNKSSAAKRISVKGKKELYKNSEWDLVDAGTADSMIIYKMEMKSLPDSMQKKSREEIKQIVTAKNIERSNIQNEIAATNAQREKYIAEERIKNASVNNTATLETAIEKIIRQQAKKFNMEIQ